MLSCRAPRLVRASRSRFLTVLPSGTRWKKTRGCGPSMGKIAVREFHCSRGTPNASRAAPHESNPPGGGHLIGEHLGRDAPARSA